MDLQKIKDKLNSKIEEVLTKLNIEHEILGDNIYSCCPVHDDSDNPRAFSYSKDKGIWKCWTRDCQNHYKSDVFGLIQGVLAKHNGEASFSDALKWSYDFLKVKQSKYNHAPSTQTECDFSNIVKTIRSLNILEHEPTEIFLNEYKLEIPSAYFINRGFDADTLKHFCIGDCHDKGSKFFERSIIPIHNDNGTQLIGCTARAIKEYKSPKFLLYPKGFDKRYYLYNYHRAIEHVNQTSSLFLVEGQSDVWRLHEAGIKQVMGVFGRTLSKEQEHKISKMPVTQIVILMDNDQAGRESKVQIQRQLGRMYKLSFPKIPTKDIGEMTVQQIHNIILPQLKGLKV